jgi:hypothetical protein
MTENRQPAQSRGPRSSRSAGTTGQQENPPSLPSQDLGPPSDSGNLLVSILILARFCAPGCCRLRATQPTLLANPSSARPIEYEWKPWAEHRLSAQLQHPHDNGTSALILLLYG